jgi:hypothetical protein
MKQKTEIATFAAGSPNQCLLAWYGAGFLAKTTAIFIDSKYSL